MKKIYAESWALFRQGALGFFAMAVFLETMLYFLPSSFGASIGTSMAGIILAFFVHRHFLKGEDYFSRNVMFKRSKYDQRGINRFMFLSFGLLVLTVILTLALTFSLLDFDWEEDILTALTILFASLASWLVLGLFGTILPAAANNDAHFRLSMGMAKFPTMMVRLLVGPGLASASLLGALFIAIAVLSALGFIFNFWVERFLGVLGYFLTFFTVILTAATLCSVYRMIETTQEISE